MGLTLSTAPSAEPVTLAEAKEWLRVDTGDTSQDNVLAILIKDAREVVEEYLGRSLIDQTWTWEMNSEDMKDPIDIPRPPIQSITSLTEYDEASGSETTNVTTSTNYQLIEGFRLVQRNDGWQINRKERAGKLIYVAGYGAAGSNIPQPIKTAILRKIATDFENREDRLAGTIVSDLSDESKKKLAKYRYYGI